MSTPPALSGDATATEAATPAGLQISDDVIVDTALDILNSAHVDYLLVRGDDGRCAGVLTRAQLAPYRTRSWYTERIRVRDIVHDRGPYPGPRTPLAAAVGAMHTRSLPAVPVLDEDGCVLGVLTLAVLRTAPAAPAAGQGVAA
ncbi:CBS domain-containing protein [Streptomyces sp. NPDC092296]|uniref:CBS domain-containing protein n=1 Tax=Streptomyces sp. NPDC092296 TaxID=3366012 RepID=UPI0037F8F3D7